MENFYYDKNKSISPYLIHFNYVVGHVKRDRMIEHNKWYLPNA